ncbi:Penicillin-binding protein 1F [Sporomusa rhizae]|uniref:transglycosylase domain-containing protein n=1 Tax=Sporomusa rhizae TaxID=357999 RepID=UPI00352B6D62
MPNNTKKVIACTVLLVMLTNIGYAFLGLPETKSLENLNLVSATQVYDINGQLISKLFEENRVVVTINNISPYVQQAIIANEDTRFYSHFGLDPIGIMRAIVVNIRHGSLIEGGSTLTQQLAKNMFLTQERTLLRKLKEAMLAVIIDYKFSKQEILQAYLNQVYFGEGAYGIEAAAQMYFGKHAKDLTLAESALLAGLPRGPNIYSPYVDIKAATDRRSVVLAGMVKEGYVTEQDAAKSKAEPINLAGKKKRLVQASYFLDYISNELVGRYGANRVYKGGLKVYTSLDIKQQQAAEAVLGELQGAVLALDPKTGYVKAMVGGRDYEESQINRVFAEVRQPGSAFKPFLYAAALNEGLTANATIIDEPININGYSPLNYDKKYRGTVTLKKALRWSVNIPAVKLAQQIGIDKALNLAKNMGITTIVPEDYSLSSALGGLTQGVNLWEMTSAYTAFANGGVVSKPIAILKVLDENDQVLEENRIIQQSVLRPEVAYILTDMLKGVLQDGTGTPASLGRPAAGKTGTTDNYETAWFIGYTPDLLVGIYAGYDNRKPIGVSGTEMSALWGKMVSKLVANTPPTDFPIPPNVVVGIPICATSGKLATLGCKEVEYSAFIQGTQPTAPQWPSTNENQTKPAEKQEQKQQPFWKWPWSRLPSF